MISTRQVAAGFAAATVTLTALVVAATAAAETSIAGVAPASIPAPPGNQKVIDETATIALRSGDVDG